MKLTLKAVKQYAEGLNFFTGVTFSLEVEFLHSGPGRLGLDNLLLRVWYSVLCFLCGMVSGIPESLDAPVPSTRNITRHGVI